MTRLSSASRVWIANSATVRATKFGARERLTKLWDSKVKRWRDAEGKKVDQRASRKRGGEQVNEVVKPGAKMSPTDDSHSWRTGPEKNKQARLHIVKPVPCSLHTRVDCIMRARTSPRAWPDSQNRLRETKLSSSRENRWQSIDSLPPLLLLVLYRCHER